MNKTELVAALAEKTQLPKKKGDKVQIVGFGSFEVKDRPERIARNPQKPEEEITIPASKAPVFKAGKSLKDAVNQ